MGAIDVLLIGSIGLLAVLLIGLTAVIVTDVHQQGWGNWLGVLREWQSTLGTVMGFVGGAGVLILGTALDRQAEADREDHAAHAIGQALAYEAERMAGALELGRQFAAGIDMTDPVRVSQACGSMARAVHEQMQERTPVFDASVQRLVDFGDQNLSNFVRFYAFYADLRQTLANVDEATCSGISGEAYVNMMVGQMRNGLGYYARFAPDYQIAQFTPDGLAPAGQENQ